MGRIDLDRPVERRGTDSFKWDAVGRFFGREDVIPMWGGGYGLPLCARDFGGV